jgi:hypothetical protein
MRSKVLIFLGLLCIVVIGGLISQLPQSVVPIKNIACSLEQSPCPDTLQAALRPLTNKSLLFTKLESEIGQLPLHAYELDTIRKKLPGTLVLAFKPKKNSYVLNVGENAEKWVIAQSGYAQQTAPTETLPEVFISTHGQSPIHDQQLDPTTHQLVQSLLDTLERYQLEVHKIELRSSTEIVLTLPNNLQALLSNDQTDQQVRKLSIITKNLDLATIDTGIRTIDLRFRLPVLKT